MRTTRSCAWLEARRAGLRLSRKLDCGEPFADAAGGGECFFARITLERLVQGCGRLLAAAGELEHFGEVGEGVALGEDVVRVSEERDGFVCQRLRFVVLSAPCEYFRLYPTRQDSGGRVVAGA